MKHKLHFLCLLGFALLMSAMASSVEETVVFQDTFDVPDGSDVNTDIDTRQAGGKVVSPYVAHAGINGRSSIESNHLHRVGQGKMTLSENLADPIDGKSFTFSVDMRYTSTEGWGSVSILSEAGSARGLTPCSIRLHGENKGLVVVTSGNFGDPIETHFGPRQLTQLLGESFEISNFHNYKYMIHMNGGNGTVSFYIDGVEVPLDDNMIDFGDKTTRRINFINIDPGNTLEVDNLKLMVEKTP